MNASRPWWLPAGAWAASLLVRALGATWSIDRSGLVERDAEIAGGTRFIFACWHARLLPLAYTHRNRGIVMLVSRHRDGEWIANVIRHFGFGTARGSSTRGGEEGMRQLLAAAAANRLIGFTPDGPRGPAERVKEGLVWLASHTGWPIVPVAAAADRAHEFSSWDRFRVPLPFARVVVAYGEPIPVPRDADATQLGVARESVERALTELTRRVAQRAGERS